MKIYRTLSKATIQIGFGKNPRYYRTFKRPQTGKFAICAIESSEECKTLERHPMFINKEIVLVRGTKEEFANKDEALKEYGESFGSSTKSVSNITSEEIESVKTIADATKFLMEKKGVSIDELDTQDKVFKAISDYELNFPNLEKGF